MYLHRTLPEPCPKCGSEASESSEVLTVANCMHVFKKLFCFFCNYTRQEHETSFRDEPINKK